MDKELKDKLEANGFDVDVTLQRFMNNEKLYFKFLKKLPADQNYVSFGEAINSCLPQRAYVKRRIVQFRCGQCFKGVRANGGKITCQ